MLGYKTRRPLTHDEIPEAARDLIDTESYVTRLAQLHVRVLCRGCGFPRYRPVAKVRAELSAGKTSLLCHSCAVGFFKPVAEDFPEHLRGLLALDRAELAVNGQGARYWRVPLSCSSCGKERFITDTEVNRTRRSLSTFCRVCFSKQSQKGKFGSASAGWRGGRHIRNGYVYTYARGHPNATKDGYVMEHRLVMESVLGRQLLSQENVHHKNGIKDDNRVENLELWKRSQPYGVREADYHCPGCRCAELVGT